MRFLLRKILLLIVILFVVQNVSVVFGTVNQQQEASFFQKKIAWIKSFFKKQKVLSAQELIRGFEQAAEDPFFYMRPAKAPVVSAQLPAQAFCAQQAPVVIVPPKYSGGFFSLQQKYKKFLFSCLFLIGFCTYLHYLNQLVEAHVKVRSDEIQQAATVVIESMKKDFSQRLALSDQKIKNFETVQLQLIAREDDEFKKLFQTIDDIEKKVEGFEGVLQENCEEHQAGLDELDLFFEQLKETNVGQEEKITAFVQQVKQIEALALQKTNLIDAQKVTIKALEAKVVAVNKQLLDIQGTVNGLKK